MTKTDNMEWNVYYDEFNQNIYMASWVVQSKPIKIDIYSQVKLNWNRFVDYCWSFKED